MEQHWGSGWLPKAQPGDTLAPSIWAAPPALAADSWLASATRPQGLCVYMVEGLGLLLAGLMLTAWSQGHEVPVPASWAWPGGRQAGNKAGKGWGFPGPCARASASTSSSRPNRTRLPEEPIWAVVGDGRQTTQFRTSGWKPLEKPMGYRKGHPRKQDSACVFSGRRPLCPPSQLLFLPSPTPKKTVVHRRGADSTAGARVLGVREGCGGRGSHRLP